MRDLAEVLIARVLKESGSETSSTNGTGVDVGAAQLPSDHGALALLNVTAKGADATQTMTVAIDGSVDGTTWVQDVASFAAIGDALSKQAISVPVYRHYRYASTIGGSTPDYTYEVYIISRAQKSAPVTQFA